MCVRLQRVGDFNHFGQNLACERIRIFSVTGSAENNVCEPELENDFCDVTTFVFSLANHIA